MPHEQSETIQRPDKQWVNVYGRRTKQAGQQLPGTPSYSTVDEAVTAAKARSKAYDPGLAAHLREYPSGTEDLPEGFVLESGPGENDDLPPGFVEVSPPPVSSSTASPSFLSKVVSGTGKRWKQRGTNLIDVLGAAVPTWDEKGIHRRPLPGDTRVEKLGSVMSAIDTLLGGGILSLGGAVSEAISERAGLSPERAQQHGDISELLGGLALGGTGFFKTAPSKLHKVGIGRPTDEAAAMARVAADVKGRPYTGFPLTTSERLAGEYGDAFPRELSRELFITPAKKAGKAKKPTGVWKTLSDKTSPGVEGLENQSAQDLIATLSRTANPSIEEIAAAELLTTKRGINLLPPEGVPLGPGTRATGKTTLFDVPPYRTSEEITAAELAAARRGVNLLPPEAPSGTVELGMGLQIPKEWKDSFKRVLIRAKGSLPPGHPEATSELDAILGPVGKRGHSYNTDPTIFSRALGPKIGEQFRQVHRIKDELQGRFGQIYRSWQLNKLSRTEQINLMQTAEKRAAPMSPRIAEIAEQWKQLETENAQFKVANKAEVLVDPTYSAPTGAQFKAGKWRPWTPREGYIYQAFDYREIAKTPIGTVADELAKAMPTQLTPSEAMEMAKILKAQAHRRPITSATSTSEAVQRLLRQGEPGSPHLHARTGLVIPDRFRVLPEDSVAIWMENTARDNAVLQVFGPRDAGMEQALENARAQRRPDATLAQNNWDRFRGRRVYGAAQLSVSRAGRILHNAAVTTLLGPRTAVKQMTQYPYAVPETGVKNLIKGIVKGFSKDGQFDPERFGSLVNDVRSELSMGQFTHDVSHAPSMMEKLDIGLQRSANAVANASWIVKMDKYPRVATHHGMVYKITDLQADARIGDANALRQLERLGVTPTSTFEEINRAAKIISDKVNLRSGPLELPSILYEPGFELPRSLTAFNYAILKRNWEGYLKPLMQAIAKKDRRETGHMLKKIATYGASLAVGGEIQGDVLRMLQNRASDRPGGSLDEFAKDLVKGKVPPIVFGLRLLDNLTFSGATGQLQNFKEALLAQGGPGEKTGRMWGALGGAGLSNVVGLVAQGADVLQKEATGTDKEKEHARTMGLRALASRVPGLNTAVPFLFEPSKGSAERQAVEKIARMKNRGEYGEIGKVKSTFRRQYGKSLSGSALREAGKLYRD